MSDHEMLSASLKFSFIQMVIGSQINARLGFVFENDHLGSNVVGGYKRVRLER